jgi:hypothetical protein
MLFLAAAGTLFGIAFGTNAKHEILLVVPYLTLGATAIICQHHEVIGALGLFLHNELHPFLLEIGEAAPEWDTSHSLKEHLPRFMRMRSLAHSVLLVSPPLAALAINWHYALHTEFPGTPMWYLGLVFMLISCVAIYASHTFRKRIQKSFNVLDASGQPQ